MGQGISCKITAEELLLNAILEGDFDNFHSILQTNSPILDHPIAYNRNSALHIAASHGQIQILSSLLDKSANPDSLNRFKQTPLMLAAMYGKVSCVRKLIEAGANILMFDSVNGRTCLHYAAYYGHPGCLEAILSAARSSQVAASWGFSRFVNVRDGKGATPLHLAARHRRPECVHILLDNGALVCATTGRYGFSGSTPLHLAARSGCLDSVRELLAWGADRLQTDTSGKIPYTVALRHQHRQCLALLNPSSAEPLVWPYPLKFISELNHEAKALLERALMDANKEREKNTIEKGIIHPLPSSSVSGSGIDDNASEVSEADLCGICFDQACAIEVQECGHQMCAQCTLVLCCHTKPDPTTASPCVPVCPFCRSNIVKLVVAKVKPENDKEHDATSTKPRKSWLSRNSGEGSSSSSRGLSGRGSFGRMGRGSGRIVAENEWLEKPVSLDV